MAGGVFGLIGAFQQAQAGIRLQGSLAAFRAAPGGGTAFQVGSDLVGVIGTDRVVGALVRYGVHLALKAQSVDDGAGQEIVDRARSRVPQDTGTLFNGIERRREGGAIVVSANAVRPGDHNYARDVEFGRGARTHADAGFFESADGPRRRPRQPEGDGSQEARPFFLNSAYEVLEGRPERLANASREAAQQEGF